MYPCVVGASEITGFEIETRYADMSRWCAWAEP